MLKLVESGYGINPKMPTVYDYGTVVADGMTDCYAAFTAAISAKISQADLEWNILARIDAF